MVESLPKVSIVLPTYNGSKYLRQAIDSCLNQTYRNIELVIVDDGSTDETREVIKSYADQRIKCVRHYKNRGLPHALNTGFSNTTGEFLAWTSDDNQYLPGAVEEMVNSLRENEDADLVYADYWSHYLDTGKKELRRLPDRLALNVRNEVGPCFLYTRKVYEEIGGYDPKYELVEDYDYWIRISKRFKMFHYPHPLYVYGEHGRSLKGMRFQSINLFDALLRYRNGYLPRCELGGQIFSFFAGVLRSPRRKHERIFLLLSNFIRIGRLSWSLAFLSFFLSMGKGVYKFALKLCSKCSLVIETGLSYFNMNRRCSVLIPSEQKRNVLWIIPYMVSGGSERVVLNIVKGMDRGRFAFHLMTTHPADHAWFDQFELFFQNIVIPFKRATLERICYRYFCELIERLHAEIVVISNSKIGYKELPRLKENFPRLRILDILHSEEGWGTRAEFMKVVPYLDKRICISHLLEEVMTTRYRENGIGQADREKLMVIHNGIDTTEYSPERAHRGLFKSRYGIPMSTKIVSFIGRFAEEKNPFLFVDIARSILSRYRPDKIRFIMAGDGPDFERVKSFIDRNGMKDCFLLPGMVEHTTSLLADTSILLVVSRSEGIPLVIEEAMAMKVPTVSMNVGAISEVIQDELNGYLINSDSDVVGGFTNRVLDLLSRAEEHSRVSERAYQTVISNYTLEVMGRKYQLVFDEFYR